MEKIHLVSADQLNDYARGRAGEANVPELVWMLVNRISDLRVCRIPYGDAINQPGLDGLVETEEGFGQFVPAGRSYWEIGTGRSPQSKATRDFTKRTKEVSAEDRANLTYVFVTPRGSGAGGWTEPAQRKWLNSRRNKGWKDIKILDAVRLTDWMREFPWIGKWLLKKAGLINTVAGFHTSDEHWEMLAQLSSPSDPPLPPKVFLTGRDQACVELQRVFAGETNQMVVGIESELDAEDFVSAFLASLNTEQKKLYEPKCLFVSDADTWESFANLKIRHVLVASPQLDLESSGERLHLVAKKSGHAVIIPVSSAGVGGQGPILLRNPTASLLQPALIEAGYTIERAHEMAEAGTMSLASLKRHLRGVGGIAPYASWPNARALAQAELLGRWLGENASDQAIIGAIVGKSYGEWIEGLRPETLKLDTPLTQRNENWKVISRSEAWNVLGVQLTNLDLERVQKAALEVLSEVDPQFELPPDERMAANIKGKILKHSHALRSGLAETVALLGSRSRALSSCSQGRPENVAAYVVRELLSKSEWMLWTSLNDYIPLLAEAAPDEFLEALENHLSDTNSTLFAELFRQEGPGVFGSNYMTGVLWGLESLAWSPDYLSRVLLILGALAEIDPGGRWSNRPASSLATILLPWHPQTRASIPKRKAAVQGLLNDFSNVGWKLLISLLPSGYGVSSGTHKPRWRDYAADHTSIITVAEYHEQVNNYAELVSQQAKTDIKRLEELISHLTSLPSPAFNRIVEHLGGDQVASLVEDSRTRLWESLLDLAAKHRKFSAAKWAMRSDLVTLIENTAAKLKPKSPLLLHRRLFSDRDYDLFEAQGDYARQRRDLQIRRKEAVRAIFDQMQVGGILKFVSEVPSPQFVGDAFAEVAPDTVDIELIPDLLEDEDLAKSTFIKAFVYKRFINQGWIWVEKLGLDHWTSSQGVAFFTMLPFRRDVWVQAETFLRDNAESYWKKVFVNPWLMESDVVEAAQKLLEFGRPRAATHCLYCLVQNAVDFDPQIAIDCLMAGLNSTEVGIGFDQHDIVKIVQWLQDDPRTKLEALFRVEWAYLPLLDHEYGAEPKTVEHGLATDPSLFCTIIRLVFRSDRDKDDPKPISEGDQQIAQNGYRLLDRWSTIPGSKKATDDFDASAFTSWLSEVKKSTKASGHYPVAMSKIGEVLTFASSDPDGLWIHRSIAQELNARDAKEMRSGFRTRTFNRRGVFTFSAGKEEFGLAHNFTAQADALEEAGFTRFAATIRELAKYYVQTAERESERSPFDD